MTSRASLKLTINGTNEDLDINLGQEKDYALKCRNGFLYRFASDRYIAAALARKFGRKTTFSVVDESKVKYSDGGKTVTFRAMVMKPIHGREGVFENIFGSDDRGQPKLATLTFSLPVIAQDAGESEEASEEA